MAERDAGSRAMLDAWVRRELARAHDATLREPLPEEMLRLLDGLPAQ